MIILFFKILGRSLILHGKEDDLGIARGRFLEGRIKLGDTIPVSTRLKFVYCSFK